MLHSPTTPKMADDPDGDLAEAVVFGVGQGLGRGDDDALARMDPHRVEVLHVADRDAVVGPVPDDLILDLFPALEVLLDEDLAGGDECLGQGLAELPGIVGDAASFASQGVGDTGHHGVADRLRGPQSLFDAAYRNAARRLEPDLRQGTVEELPVLRFFDRLHRRPEDLRPVPGEGA